MRPSTSRTWTVSISRLGRREGIGAATVERYFRHGLQRQFCEWHAPHCPLLLGIDEHFLTRRKGYATTFCDLRNHKVYDVVLGRSEAALEAYLGLPCHPHHQSSLPGLLEGPGPDG